MEGLHSAAITNKLAEHLRRGELLDLAPDLASGSPVDGAIMMSWDSTHSIAAHDIRELLRGRIVTDPDPRGLRLRAACIRGRLDLDNLTTTVKLTLLDCLLDEGITARAAHLPGLSLRRCRLTHASEPALYADELRTDAGVSLAGCTIRTRSAEGALRMSGAHIGGHLDCSGAVVTSRSDPQHRWSLDGLTYPRLPLDPLGTGTAGWLDLFRTATPAYAAQPYQQLASVHQAAGHDRDVRQIHIAQRQAQLDRGVLTGRDRLWVRITGLTLGYGYQPWRALLFLVGVVVTSVVLAITLGGRGALVHPPDPKNSAAATTPCTITERVEVGLAVGAPFFDTHARDRCTTTNTAAGIALSYSSWGLQLLTGALAALFVAGFTGIVRKT